MSDLVYGSVWQDTDKEIVMYLCEGVIDDDPVHMVVVLVPPVGRRPAVVEPVGDVTDRYLQSPGWVML